MNEKVESVYREKIHPMFEFIYEKMRKDLIEDNKNSYIYTHHINYIEETTKYYSNKKYRENGIDDIVVDYVASMTDDYLIDLCNHYYPDGRFEVKYRGYFE